MKNLGWRLFLIFIIFAELCGHAQAKSWTVDYANSHLGFSGQQDINIFQGTFKTFTADIDFDPDHPENGKINVTVDISSATTNDEQRDSMLPQSDWFNTVKFPEAQFVSSAIRRTGPDSFEAQGNLTIKGISQPVSLPFTLQQEGDHWHAQGKTSLTRTDFHIGEGQWSNDETVKLGVEVMIDIVAKPQV